MSRPGILFPATDAFTLFVSRHRHELSTAFLFTLPSADVMEAIVNKKRQYELAEQVGTPYAATYYPRSLNEVRDIRNEIDYPAFIKPLYGHLWKEKFGGNHKGFKVDSARELEARFEEIVPLGVEVMVQSFILGPNTNHFKVSAYLNREGKPLALFTLRKIRQFPTESGVGTLVESLHYPELVELGLHFFTAIGYRGIGSIEFKKDQRDGKLKMIELNPRLWQQNIQATVCGVNFPLIQYLDLTGQNPQPVLDFRDRVKWLDICADFGAFWTYFRQGELSLLQWLKTLRGTESFATFAVDDLKPFFKSHQYGLKYLRAPLCLYNWPGFLDHELRWNTRYAPPEHVENQADVKTAKKAQRRGLVIEPESAYPPGGDLNGV